MPNRRRYPLTLEEIRYEQELEREIKKEADKLVRVVRNIFRRMERREAMTCEERMEKMIKEGK